MAVKQSIEAFMFVPDEFKTPSICRIAGEHERVKKEKSQYGMAVKLLEYDRIGKTIADGSLTTVGDILVYLRKEQKKLSKKYFAPHPPMSQDIN